MKTQLKQNQQRKLWQFHGGLHLPDNKSISLQQPLAILPLPKQLIIPLQQHIGETPEIIVTVGEKVAKGQMLAKPSDYVSAPVHAPSSGTVTAIDEQEVPHPSGLKALCITLETDGNDQWSNDLPPAMESFQERPVAELKERIRWAGIVGLGGATFPTGVKLNPGPDKKIETLIVNGAECEPYITCDDSLMQHHAADIIHGIEIVMHILSADNCLVGIEDNKPLAIEKMRSALIERDLQNIEVVVIPTLYPSGGEKQLIQILTGREVPSHGLPSDIGIVCHNVATLSAISDAVLLGRPLISRIVTVTGAGVKQPRNVLVANGSPISALIEFAGGYNEHVDKLILGGPMMGFTLPTDRIPATKGTNCILVTTTDEIKTNTPAMACIRCGKCAEVCPANLLPQQLYWFARSRDLDKVQDYDLFDCIECGCCAHVCPSHIPLVQYYRFAKTEVWAKEEEKRKSDIARRRHEFRDARLARIEAEKKARLRKKKEALEAKNSGTKDPKKAAIEAAMKRAAEKKRQLQESGTAPANTENLSQAQKQQIEAADKRRQESSS